MSRFDYVKYDEESVKVQGIFKEQIEGVSKAVDDLLVSPRAKALVQTKLEEAYMWIGKAVRDDQIVRNGKAESQEQRKDG